MAVRTRSARTSRTRLWGRSWEGCPNLWIVGATGAHLVPPEPAQAGEGGL